MTSTTVDTMQIVDDLWMLTIFFIVNKIKIVNELIR
jgi:hypothetical protein